MSGEAVLATSRLRSKRTEGGATGDLRFAGYAAIFDRVDRGGDVVRAGAFGDVAAAGVPDDLAAPFWEAVRENLKTRATIAEWSVGHRKSLEALTR